MNNIFDWEELIDEFLRLKGGEEGSDTYVSYKRTAENFHLHIELLYDKPILLPDVSAEDVSSFILAEISSKRSKSRKTRLDAIEAKKTHAAPSPSTVNNRLAILSGLYDVAIYNNSSIVNHPKNLRAILGRKFKESGKKKDHGETQRKKALNKRELKAFYRSLVDISFTEPKWKKGSKGYEKAIGLKRAIIERNLTMFRLFEATGVRVSGMAQLNIDDLNIDTMEITVTEKGGKRRVAPIIPSSISEDEMQQSLVDWLEVYRPQFMSGKTHSYLWVGNRGNPIQNWLIQDLCRRAMEDADLHKPYFGPHLLRHTFATDKLDSGNSPRDVAMVMGHADLQSISTYDSGEAKDARERMKKNSWS